jgi:hypothetical protein
MIFYHEENIVISSEVINIFLNDGNWTNKTLEILYLDCKLILLILKWIMKKQLIIVENLLN